MRSTHDPNNATCFKRILELIASEEIDLLATGTRGMGPLAELLLGSVSDKLIQLADCPVLLSR